MAAIYGNTRLDGTARGLLTKLCSDAMVVGNGVAMFSQQWQSIVRWFRTQILRKSSPFPITRDSFLAQKIEGPRDR